MTRGPLRRAVDRRDAPHGIPTSIARRAILWLRYGLARGRPSAISTEIYSMHLERPGTKAHTRKEAIQRE